MTLKSAIFCVPFDVGIGPRLSQRQLTGQTGDGPLPPSLAVAPGTGYSVIGHVPAADTCLVRVWAEEAVLDALAVDPSGNYLFVEDVIEQEVPHA